MSIKFICSCGKRLRARNEMAARRSMCPRCGAPVGIPSLRPTHAGTAAGPLTPQERRKLNREKSSLFLAPDAVPAVSADLPPPPARPRIPWRSPRVRRARHLETRWYHCLLYPLLNGPILWVLAAALTLLSGGAVQVMPELPRFAAMTPKQWLPYTTLLLLPLALLAYVAGTVECGLKSALAGEGPAECWPGRHVLFAFKSGLRWLVCFFAGPLAPLLMAGYFWLYGGDLTGLDRVLVAEMLILAAAYWLLAVVCSAERDRLRDANPVRVVELLHALKFRAVVPLLVAPALACAHGATLFLTLTALHEHVYAWLLLGACWISGLFCLTFLFRLLGVWCFHAGGLLTDPLWVSAEAASSDCNEPAGRG